MNFWLTCYLKILIVPTLLIFLLGISLKTINEEWKFSAHG